MMALKPILFFVSGGFILGFVTGFVWGRIALTRLSQLGLVFRDFEGGGARKAQ